MIEPEDDFVEYDYPMKDTLVVAAISLIYLGLATLIWVGWGILAEGLVR